MASNRTRTYKNFDMKIIHIIFGLNIAKLDTATQNQMRKPTWQKMDTVVCLSLSLSTSYEKP